LVRSRTRSKTPIFAKVSKSRMNDTKTPKPKRLALLGSFGIGFAVAIILWTFPFIIPQGGTMVSQKPEFPGTPSNGGNPPPAQESDRPVGVLIAGNASGNKFFSPEFVGDMDGVKIKDHASNNEIHNMKVHAPARKTAEQTWYSKPFGVISLSIIAGLATWLILRFFRLA